MLYRTKYYSFFSIIYLQSKLGSNVQKRKHEKKIFISLLSLEYPIEPKG